ncbi:thiamine transporter 1 isoform X2 [Phycodurus eques]|uniref:thiamine transporter 1 isoform X2 n=1 Tax=Phycodurus eques TaxID=693459 RepID=UPI002ACEB3E9|nr:thiamine transporter 1 isoform X2 [Phycodurus eques]
MPVLYSTLCLCAYGLFSNLRPSEPFLTAYLMGPDKNLTEAQVVSEIYPIWTYSYLALLFPVFLATDYLCYKPVLVLQAVSFVVTYVMLLKAHGLRAMQLLEFFFGLATASEVAYFSYIYNVVEPAHYRRVTAYCRSVTLFGSAAGSLTGQLLLTLAEVKLVHLVWATLASAVVAFVPPWFLPMPKRSLFFHKKPEGAIERQCDYTGALIEKVDNKVPLDNEDVSIVLNYAQPLWENIRPSSDYDIYNGYVETLSTLMGAVAALLVGHLPVRWTVWGELVLCALSLLMAACVFVMVTLKSIWLCYGSYILFRATYMLLITVATYQVASSLDMQRYAMVFGVNTFVALLLQSLLTLVVVDSAGLGLDVFTQFYVYGGYFAVISTVFLFAGLCKLSMRRHAEQEVLSRSPVDTDST